MTSLKKIFFALSMISFVLHANETFTDTRILGLEVGSGKIQADTLLERDHSGRDIAYGIRFGTQSNEWRALLVGSWLDSSDDDQKYLKATVQFDYFILQESMLRPYVGLNLGYMKYETTLHDDNGLLYGGDAGLQFRISDTMAIDITYRYSLSNSDVVDHVEGIMFGIDYLY